MKKYLLYHLHSDYSLLDSCTDYKNYCDLVKRDGGTAISFTEHGYARGWINKKLYCDQIGIKFIHGVEIYLTRSFEEKVRDNYHTVLLAKNMDGIRELNSLMNKSSQEDHFYYTNRISFNEFLNLSNNIIKTSACLAGPLNKLDEDDEWFERLVLNYNFLEIQPHHDEEQVSYNRKLLVLSKKYGIPLIVGTDTHSSTQYKAECRDILLKAKGRSYGNEDKFDLVYKNYDELLNELLTQDEGFPQNEYIQALDNTNLIEEMCESFDLDKSFKYPIIHGSPNEDERLFEERSWRMLDEKLEAGIIPKEQEPAFREAIADELRVFKKIGMGGFMLSMSDLMIWCKSQGMAVGTARGSVGGSRTAYVTDIIDLNPEQWHTVFSRFANEDRIESGDIDTDLVYEDREQVFTHIKSQFGIAKTARVAAYGTIASLSAIDEIARALSRMRDDAKYSLENAAKIKRSFEKDPEQTRLKWPELFKYYDGLIGTRISQSVHPAGMVISPITLDDNYGTFKKDGEQCLLLDMDEAHEVGLIKYDLLVLTTVQIIRDTCRYLGRNYPRTHEIDWDDKDVWDDVCKDQTAIFQFESPFAKDCFKKFKPRNIFEMTMLTAAMRPSGSSYRDDLLARKVHKNQSSLIDELLKDNLGYLIYQEDTIKFLQEICGLSGSEADSIRRAIGKKDKVKIDASMPRILDGYCKKSDKPRAEAEKEAKEFLRVIEDSASYQFGKNHAIAYSLLSYMCAYFRYYYPVEFITAYLNNAKTEENIQSGAKLAAIYKVRMENPKWPVSMSGYFYNKEKRTIYRGLSSIKYIGHDMAEQLHSLGTSNKYDYFIDLLQDIDKKTKVDSRALDILAKIDYFSPFGNQREVMRIIDLFRLLKCGEAKRIKRDLVDGTPLQERICPYVTGDKKDGSSAVNYTVVDMKNLLRTIEECVKSAGMSDLDDITKLRNFQDAMGGAGYVSYRDQDRRKLSVMNVVPLKKKSTGEQFGYSVFTKSIGSGKDSRFTLFNKEYKNCPIKKNDIIICDKYRRDGKYFVLQSYRKLV